MACFWPSKCYIGPEKEEGKKNIVWKRNQSYKGEEIYLPCGQCIGCRLERSRQWAVRCLHEASLYENNCFVTLTYNDGCLPINNSLDVSEWQEFFKRLRKKYGSGIRYFHCGEYGEKLSRPHYHGIIFNHDFEDKVLFKEENGNKLYISESLNGLWKKGFTTVGEVNFKTAGYVARYALKKVNGDMAESHYHGLKPEYVTMSRGCKKLNTGGIGKGWFDKFKSEVYPWDEVVVNGVPTRPPRFYDNLLDKENQEMLDLVKMERELRMKEVGREENDSFRLPVKEKCCEDRIKNLTRKMEK